MDDSANTPDTSVPRHLETKTGPVQKILLQSIMDSCARVQVTGHAPAE